MRPRASNETPTRPLPSAPSLTAESILSPPYGTLALHYDTVMAHVDYPGWARHLRGLWRSVRGRTGKGSKPGRVLELAAGTCRFASPPLFPDVFTVHTDLSPAMLAVARDAPARAACNALSLPFRDGPARGGIAGRAGFDLVLMVYDSLNYLTRQEEVCRLFGEALRVLTPGGVFLFDVTTATCSRRHFADTLDFQETEAGAVIRASRYDAKSRTQLNLFTFFTAGPDGRYERHEEINRQRVWPAALLKKTAREAGFTVRACLADFTLNPGSDRHERLHFVLQKPEVTSRP
jgi:SAM-dependent methyltransferase